MAIGMSGLVSGLDTDTIVQALVSGYSSKKDDLTKEQTKLQWKMDSWKALNTKVYNLYSKSLSNLRFTSNYVKKTTDISDATIAKITAGSSSVNGTQSLAVKQLATSGYLTGGKVNNVTDSSKKLTASSTLADLGVTQSASLVVGVDGKETSVSVDGTTTISDLVKKLSNAGVSASFDENNQRFFVSSKESGADHDFTITANNAGGNAALKALGLQTSEVSSSDLEYYKTWASYAQSGNEAAFEAATQAAIDAAYEAKKTTTAAQKSALNKNISNLNSQDTAIYQAQLLEEIKTKFAGGADSDEIGEFIANKKSALEASMEESSPLTDAEKEACKRNLQAITALESSIKDSAGKYSSDKVDSQLTKVKEALGTLEAGDYTAQLNQNATERAKWTEIVNDAAKLEEYTNQLNTETKASVTTEMTQECEDRRAYAKAFMAQYNYAHQGEAGVDAVTEEEYNKAVADYGNLLGTADDGTGNGATRIEGQNAIIYLNGAKFENNENTFSINGLTITATETTGLNDDGTLKTVSISTSDDTEAIYDMVRDFLSEYNSIINEMDKLYNAESSKGYEPLTDDEKSELSDEEVEKWETKIKDSLLKGDSTLNSVSQAMKNAMQQGFKVGEETLYLSDFGIGTLSYFTSAKNERSALHIDGDEEDSATAGKTDKLKAMIATDPDKVVDFFTQLSNNLYTQLTNKMSATTLSSTYTLYNDKQMQSEYSQYTTKIAEQAEKVTWWENYYLRQFTAMEKSMATLNSQQSALSGLFSS